MDLFLIRKIDGYPSPAGEWVSAKHKGKVRRELLVKANVAIDALTNIDTVDAALCALAAHYVLLGRYRMFGDAQTGFIVVPGPT